MEVNQKMENNPQGQIQQGLVFPVHWTMHCMISGNLHVYAQDLTILDEQQEHVRYTFSAPNARRYAITDAGLSLLRLRPLHPVLLLFACMDQIGIISSRSPDGCTTSCRSCHHSSLQYDTKTQDLLKADDLEGIKG